MKNGIVAWLALAVGISAMVWNILHKSPKIGYAESTVLMGEFSESIRAKKQFQVAQEEWNKNLKTLNDSLVASMERMKAGFDRASGPKKDSMRSDLQKRNDDLQRYSNAVKKLAEDKEHELMDPVMKKVNSFLDIWGKQHGYDLLLGTMAGGNILQANQGLNVTAAVLKDLNENYRDLPVGNSGKSDSTIENPSTGKKP